MVLHELVTGKCRSPLGTWAVRPVGRRHTFTGVPSFDALEPLAPDACRSDHGAPCYYLHLKRRALNGERSKLSLEELVFVGVGVPTRGTSGGWRSAGGIAAAADDLEMSAETTAMLRALPGGANQERLEFLA